MNPEPNNLIQAVVVNHNTTKFTELMIRSFYVKHTTDLNLTMTVLDNGSTEDLSALSDYLTYMEIPTEIHAKIYHSRLHPCCALVRNTPIFRSVVEEVGLTGLKYCWVAGEEYWDTLELMTKVMKTQGLRHMLCSAMVYHFFSVSYDPRYMARKQQVCDELLAALRNQHHQ